MEILYTTTPTHYFKYGIILRNRCQNGASLTIRKSHLSDCPPKNAEDQEDLGQHPHLGKHWRVGWTSILISLRHCAMLSWSRGGLIGAVITKSITNGEHNYCQLSPSSIIKDILHSRLAPKLWVHKPSEVSLQKLLIG